MRAAIYTRISKDVGKDRLGVQRQAQDLRGLAEQRGASVVLELEDDDLTASGKVHRPDYERLIEAVSNREVDVVIAADLERLQRNLKDYVRLYEACEEARIRVAWIGGEANFATGTGVFEMELRATFAREELRKIQQRTRRKHQELAEHGKDAGGGRPFGYATDRHTVIEGEAALIREAARRALVGEPLRSICRDWQQRGIASTNGGRWSAGVLRRMLISARISGRREQVRVDGERHTGRLGQITATADWPAIISPTESDRLRALLTAPDRRREAHARKHLLSGFLRCGLCAKPMHISTARGGKHRSYSCIRGPGFSDGCGRLRIHAEPLEAHVIKQILDAVDEGAISRALRAREVDDGARDELLAVEAKLAELAKDWAEHRITRGEWLAARGALAAQQQALQRLVNAQQRRLSLDGLESAPLRTEWPLMPLHRKRAVLGLLLDYVEIRPATRRGPIFDVDRISAHWSV